MTYTETLEWMFNKLPMYQRIGAAAYKADLNNTLQLLDLLDNPHRNFKSIHIAGTNGKGSVSHMLASVFQEAGYKTGLYTSPHLRDFRERIRINGEMIPEENVVQFIDTYKDKFEQMELSFFEMTVGMAFDYFSKEQIDIAVVEVGMGGRLDSTNVIQCPELAVITRIGLDHCDWLGSTVREIAAEKAGIVKPGVPVVLGANSQEAIETVRAAAVAAGAPFVYAPDVADASRIPPGFPLAGSFNRENAVTAIAALETLGAAGAIPGIAKAEWPGRFQRVRNFIIDGAHNPPAAEALANALREERDAVAGDPCKTRREDGLILVAGFCGDKDSAAVLRTLAPFVSRGIAVKTSNPRSLTAEETAARMAQAGIPATTAPSVAEALARCGDSPTLICGSLFLAGEALAVLGIMPAPSAPAPAESFK